MLWRLTDPDNQFDLANPYDNLYREFNWEGNFNSLKITHPDGTCEIIIPARVSSRLLNWAGTIDANPQENIYPHPVWIVSPWTPEELDPRPLLNHRLENREGSHIDELGRITTFETDGLGYVIRLTDPLDNTTYYDRNTDGKVETITTPAMPGAPNGLETNYHYDDNLNLTQIEYPNQTTESWEYDPDFSQITRYTDGDGRIITFTIDPNNGDILEMTEVVGLEGGGDDIITQYQYTSQGIVERVIQPIDIASSTTTTTYFQYTTGDGWLESMAFDEGGADEATIDVITYDDAGNPTRIRDEIGRETVFVYDRLDQLTEIRYADPDGTGSTYTDVPVTQYVYTAAGDMQQVILTIANDRDNPTVYGPEKFATYYLYNPRHRVTRIIEGYEEWMDPTQYLPGVPVTSFEYDAAENLISITTPETDTNPYGDITYYSYDVLNRPVRATLPDPGDSSHSAPNYYSTYNVMGLLMAVQDPLGSVTQYRYDLRGRATDIFAPLGAGMSFTYNNAGDLVSEIDALGNVTTYGYDDLGRLETLLLPDPDTGTSNIPIQYGYDDAHRLTSVTDQLG